MTTTGCHMDAWMSRSRAWMLTQIAWLMAAGAVVATPGHSADRSSHAPRLLAQFDVGLQPVYDTPLLLAIPQDCAAVGLDFVPPIPEVPGQRPAAQPIAAPRPIPAQRLPAEQQPGGMANNARGYVPDVRAVAPVQQRLPAVTSPASPSVRVAARPGDPGSMLIDKLEASSKQMPAMAPVAAPRLATPIVQRAIEVSQPSRPAMQAVSERAFGITQNAIGLADRGAFYSSRSEFIQALRVVTQALDAQSGDSSHSTALAEGLRALTEADDFAPQGSQLEADLDLNSIVASHRTPVLKQEDLVGITSLVALQQYYTYAQQRLASASGHEPAASQALFGLGRLTVLMAERSADSRRLHAPKAMTLFQASLAVDSRNARAAHELGVLYAQFGQLEDARRLLVMSVNLSPQKETWHNLSVVHERLGEVELARKARYELQLATQAQSGRNVTSNGLAVEWVASDKFKDVARPAPEVRAAARTSPNQPMNSRYK